jgi:ubiquinol-cytochrome c reductase cytochrome b subunit
MSYWGAQVIISLFGAIPVVGEELAIWIRGDFNVSDATLNRFYSFHIILVPLILLGLVVAHIMALHEVGSNNPDGVEIKKLKDDNGVPLDGIPFHPYYTVKDIAGVAGFLIIFALILFYAPEMGGYFLEHPNFEPADPLKTPEHIAPVWYFTPYYAILRAVTIDIGPLNSKVLGVMAMGAATVIFFALPWLDRSPVKSIRYRGPLFKVALTIFVIVFFILGFLGTQPVTPLFTVMSQVCSVLYFLFFLLMPIYTKHDKTKPVPERVTFK